MHNHSASLLMILTMFAGSAAAAGPSGDFPGYGLVPKEDTGALRFLHQHPEYDGRGVVVAIFDTGVDPGAPGLQTTTDGQSKIVDLIDGSGDGDVVTTTIVQAENGTIAGLTGRTLKIDPDWNNPTGDYHIGMKRAYELYPGALVNRLTAKRLESWNAQQRAAVTKLERQIADWDAAYPAPSKKQLKQRDELVTRLAQLNQLQNDYDDPGPIFDCVVFHDGTLHRAVIDTDEDGDLTDEKPLASYRHDHEFATFGDEDLLNFAINIYDNGNLLSIVTDSGSHGTHVAGIVAAHFPDEPELNGLAPGAQLISVKIGDERLGSASCGTGEVRGCIAVIQHQCDLINMSFGGPTSAPNVGRTMEIYGDVVNKHGIIFCSSAGNEGPALSTAGSPGATTEAILGIGAYISPAMQEVQYSLRETWGARNYTFTSRGPTYDGALSVNVCGPGGAIAPVPNWELQRNAQMHGTSMSSPNVCGNLALLLSGLKSENIAYSPASVRRAIENTARKVDDVSIFAQGHGLIQVDEAFEYLRAHAPYDETGVRFNVRTAAGDRGIYLREPFEVDRPHDVRVYVSPTFHDDANNREKVDFEVRCNLRPTERWIECAEHLMLMHNGRRLDIRVDPTRLPPGAHYAEVQGFDAEDPTRGPIFRVPVTVIIPEPLDEEGEWIWSREVSFEPGYEERHFIVVPEGATWANLRMQRLDANANDMPVIVTQIVQLVPGFGYHEHQFKAYKRIKPEEYTDDTFAVVGGRTLEICLAEYSGYLARGALDVELEFFGLVPDQAAVFLDGGELYERVNVSSPLRKQELTPRGSLSTWRTAVRPTEAVVRPLDGYRDRLPEERQIYELVSTYEFSMDSAGKITPNVSLSRDPDEKTWQSRMWMIFDSARRLVAKGGLEPGPVHLDKGDYVLRYHVRLDDQDTLESLKNVVLNLDRPLASSVGLSFYDDADKVAKAGDTFGHSTLAAGDQTMLYVGTPNADSLPSGPKPGDVLLGSITYGGDGHKPGGYPVRYVVPPKPQTEDAPVAKDKEDEPEKPASQRYAEALRDWNVARLSNLHSAEDQALFDRIAGEVLSEYPNHVPVMIEQLRRATEKMEDDPWAVAAAADRVINQIDDDALAAHFGREVDPDDPAATKLHKEMTEQKKQLIEALHLKAQALLQIAEADRTGGRPETVSDTISDRDFEEAFAALDAWVDTTDDDYLTLHIDRLVWLDQLGTALELLNKKIAADKPDKELYAQRIELLKKLGWPWWQDYETKWNLVRFPSAYPPF